MGYAKMISVDELLAPASVYVKEETLRDWQVFYHENKYLFGGQYMKSLILFLRELGIGTSVEELRDLVKGFEFNNTLMNGICIALLKFSNRGQEFFDAFYVLEVPEDFKDISLDIEKGVSRSLRTIIFYET